MKKKIRKKVFQHRDKWWACRLCEIGAKAHNHVLGEGSWGADVVFIGEGPGLTEDALGRPFVGKAGRVLRTAIADIKVDTPFKYFITNLLACRPVDDNKNNRPPTPEEIKACAPRLEELLAILNPRLVVLLGNLPRDYMEMSLLKSIPDLTVCCVRHPAYIVRKGGVGCDEYQIFYAYLKESIRCTMATTAS